MEQCPKCLTPMATGAPFCPRCGYSYEYAPPATSDVQDLRADGERRNLSNLEIVLRARQALRGRWEVSYGAVFLFFTVYISGGIIPVAGAIIALLLYPPTSLGLHSFFLRVVRNAEAPQVEQVFGGFRQFGTSIICYLLYSLAVAGGFLLLIVPGIILMCGLWGAFYLLADNPDMGPMEALGNSWRITRGHRFQSFTLGCRLIGWWILGTLPLGFGLPLVYSYHLTAFAALYDEIRD